MKKEMQEELSRIPTMPEASAHAYHEHLSFLLDRVNKKLASREDLSSLIGSNPANAMFDNHRNHAVFMDNVFQLNPFSLLPDIVPWVYRAYHNHGFAFDYFSVHIRAWQEALQESLDPEVSAPLVRIYDWMLSHHSDFIALSQESLNDNRVSLQTENEEHNRFLQALLQGDQRTIHAISQEQVSAPQGLQEFYQDILQPAMYRIGELWEAGEITVSREHLASALANTAMSSQYIRVMSQTEPWKGRIVVSAAPNEFHSLGAEMIANCLEAEGWEVDYLGANIPSGDLVEHIRERKPYIVALSVAMIFNLVPTKEIVEGITQAFPQSRPWILLGGLAFAGHPELVSRVGGDGYAENCTRAIDLVEQWRGEMAHEHHRDR